jgi:hypothetical protein
MYSTGTGTVPIYGTYREEMKANPKEVLMIVTQIFRYRYQYPGKEFGCNPTRMFLVVM